MKVGRLVRYHQADVGDVIQSRSIPTEKQPVDSVPQPLKLWHQIGRICCTPERIAHLGRNTVGIQGLC